MKLYLSSCSLYALYINGQFVDCGQYPGYEDYQVYDVIDITSYTVDGVNSLFLTQYVGGKDFSTHRVLIPGVIFSVWQNEDCILNSSAECLSRVNPYYMCGDMERVSLQLGYIKFIFKGISQFAKIYIRKSDCQISSDRFPFCFKHSFAADVRRRHIVAQRRQP